LGNILVADSGNASIRKITPNGIVTTVAGAGGFSSTGGGTRTALFRSPYGVSAANGGKVYVADSGNHIIWAISADGSVILSVAGVKGTNGSADGFAYTARLNNPNGVAADSTGNVFVADTGNSTIRKVLPSGMVTTLAGKAGNSGNTDGIGNAARFDRPSGVAVDSSGNVFVTDTWNFTIRKISSTGEVTTLAGTAGTMGSSDGVGITAQFDRPFGVAADRVGNVYVADTYNHTIRKITPGGVVSTLAGLAGNFGSVDGTGSEARFKRPHGLAVDRVGNIYVADRYNYAIRKVTPNGVVTTLAGTSGQIGGADGIGGAAQFNEPIGVALDSAGNLVVADAGNNRITKGTPVIGYLSSVATTAGFFETTLSSLPPGAVIVLEASANLLDWFPIQTNTTSGATLLIRRPIKAAAGEFFRAVVK